MSHNHDIINDCKYMSTMPDMNDIHVDEDDVNKDNDIKILQLIRNAAHLNCVENRQFKRSKFE